MLKKMYASIGRGADKKNGLIGSENGDGHEVQTRFQARLKTFKITLCAYFRSIDELVMRPYFGGATEEDEQNEIEEEQHEEEEALRIFAEQHLSRYGNNGIDPNNDFYVDNSDEIRSDNIIGEFSYMRRTKHNTVQNINNRGNEDEEFMDVDIKELDNMSKSKSVDDEAI